MRSLVLVVLGLFCALVCAQAPDTSKRQEGDKYIPLGDVALKLQSVSRSTYSLFNAFQRHDLATAMLHISKNSIFIDHTLLPMNGVYQGKRGFLDSLVKFFNTVHLTDSSFRVLFVDEARGISIVKKTSSGTFRHNNAKFENISAMFFIKWSLGKISKLNIVELNPSHIYSIYQCKAEKQYMKMQNILYSCGGSCDELRNYMADDITLKFNNFYPVSLLLKANATVPEGKEIDIAIKGKDNVMKFSAFADKLYFNLTSYVKILFSNDTTVVAAKVIEPTYRLLLVRDKNYYKKVAIMYVIMHFNEKGLVKDAAFYLNRPLLPWDLRHMDTLLKEGGDTGLSINELFRSIQPAVTITPAQK